MLDYDTLGKIHYIDGQDSLYRLARAGLLGSLTKEELFVCEHYFARKAITLPFGKAKRASNPLQLIHSDICGLMNVRQDMKEIISSYL
jgi:hypothetical protein